MPQFSRVGSFPSRPMAELAVTYLHANGIDAMVWADDAGGTYPHLALYRGIALRVREEDAEAARELLAQADLEAQGTVDSGDPRANRELRPVAKWIVRIAAALVVAGFVVSEFTSR